MLGSNIGSVLATSDCLVKLVQKENFIGWSYAIDYDKALVLTNDYLKTKSQGIPHNCFLVATSFNADKFQDTPEDDKEVILLRVIGTCKLPQDEDLVRTKIDYFQQSKDIYDDISRRGFDEITQNQLQFGGLECRVLGTFYTSQDGHLRLGSDLESFEAASRLRVYRPRQDALEIIVNYIDPDRKKAATQQVQELGISSQLLPFPIGKVRYTSTDRLHRKNSEEHVVVNIQPSDFLARRTAVLGMTRTGKSNMIKQLVSVVNKISEEAQIPIGQIIYDINGEYANANQQDAGSIASAYPNNTVRYRMLEAEGFRDLRTNFYEELTEGFNIVKRELQDLGRDNSDYIRAFLTINLEEPPKVEFGEYTKWQRRTAAYKVLLNMAGFQPPQNAKVAFKVASEVNTQVNAHLTLSADECLNPEQGLSLEDAKTWFVAVRELHRNGAAQVGSGAKKKSWLDEEMINLVNMIAKKRDNDSFISGPQVLTTISRFHTNKRSGEVSEEIYNLLTEGKIVVLDLSVGDATIREKLSKQIASRIFSNSMHSFIQGKIPPNIVMYIEEAHNLIGKKSDLTESWPRIAKEGAKYKIALVYATQEVSSMHENILANTENWFITHLNNEKEIRELSKFYDFADFSRSLLRAQDVGFARVKTLSSPFVIPVQIDKFEPNIMTS